MSGFSDIADLLRGVEIPATRRDATDLYESAALDPNDPVESFGAERVGQDVAIRAKRARFLRRAGYREDDLLPEDRDALQAWWHEAVPYAAAKHVALSGTKDLGFGDHALRVASEIAQVPFQLVTDVALGAATLTGLVETDRIDVGVAAEGLARKAAGSERPLAELYDISRDRVAAARMESGPWWRGVEDTGSFVADAALLFGTGPIAAGLKTLGGVGTKLAANVTGKTAAAKLGRFLTKTAPPAIGFGVFEGVRQYYDPATGEMADGWQRAATTAHTAVMWPVITGIFHGASKVGEWVGRGGASGQIQATTWALQQGIRARPGESMRDWSRRAYEAWVAAKMPGLDRTLARKAAQIGTAGVLTTAGFSVIDAELRHRLIDGALSDDPDEQVESLVAFLGTTAGFAAMHGMGMLDWARQQRAQQPPPSQVAGSLGGPPPGGPGPAPNAPGGPQAPPGGPAPSGSPKQPAAPQAPARATEPATPTARPGQRGQEFAEPPAEGVWHPTVARALPPPLEQTLRSVHAVQRGEAQRWALPGAGEVYVRDGRIVLDDALWERVRSYGDLDRDIPGLTHAVVRDMLQTKRLLPWSADVGGGVRVIESEVQGIPSMALVVRGDGHFAKPVADLFDADAPWRSTTIDPPADVPPVPEEQRVLAEQIAARIADAPVDPVTARTALEAVDTLKSVPAELDPAVAAALEIAPTVDLSTPEAVLDFAGVVAGLNAEVAPPKAEVVPVEKPAAEADFEGAARQTPHFGRFGKGLAFISEIHEALGKPGTIGEFKARLVERSQAGEVQLVRADLVEAMPADVVKASETKYINATFHFARIPEKKTEPAGQEPAPAKKTATAREAIDRALAAIEKGPPGEPGSPAEARWLETRHRSVERALRLAAEELGDQAPAWIRSSPSRSADVLRREAKKLGVTNLERTHDEVLLDMLDRVVPKAPAPAAKPKPTEPPSEFDDIFYPGTNEMRRPEGPRQSVQDADVAALRDVVQRWVRGEDGDRMHLSHEIRKLRERGVKDRDIQLALADAGLNFDHAGRVIEAADQAPALIEGADQDVAARLRSSGVRNQDVVDLFRERGGDRDAFESVVRDVAQARHGPDARANLLAARNRVGSALDADAQAKVVEAKAALARVKKKKAADLTPEELGGDKTKKAVVERLEGDVRAAQNEVARIDDLRKPPAKPGEKDDLQVAWEAAHAAAASPGGALHPTPFPYLASRDLAAKAINAVRTIRFGRPKEKAQAKAMLRGMGLDPRVSEQELAIRLARIAGEQTAVLAKQPKPSDPDAKAPQPVTPGQLRDLLSGKPRRMPAGIPLVGDSVGLLDAVTLGAAPYLLPLAHHYWGKDLGSYVATYSSPSAGGEAKELGERAVAYTRDVQGRLAEQKRDLQRMTSGSPLGKVALERRAATAWLQEADPALSPKPELYRIPRWQGFLEGWAAMPPDAPAHAADMVSRAVGLHHALGKEAERLHLWIDLRGGRGWVPFDASTGSRLQRILTPEGIDGFVKPNSELGQRIAEAIGEANGLPAPAAMELVRQVGARLKEARDSRETARLIDILPAVVVMPNGHAVAVLEARPFVWAEGMVRRGSHRLGYVSAFGQNVPAVEMAKTKLRELGKLSRQQLDPADELAAMQVVEDLIRNGHLVADPVAWPASEILKRAQALRKDARSIFAAAADKAQAEYAFRAFLHHIAEAAKASPLVRGDLDPPKYRADLLDPTTGRFVTEAADPAAAQQALAEYQRALHGLPIDEPILRPGSRAALAWRRVVQPFVLLPWTVGKLTRAFIPNIPEPFGNLAAVVGTRRVARSVARVWGMALSGRWKALDAFMLAHAKQGALDIEVPHWPLLERKSGHFADAFARSFKALALPQKFINELNDAIAAHAGESWVNDLRAGRSLPEDLLSVQQLGFQPAAAAEIVAGRGTPAQYRRLQQKVRTTQGVGTPAELGYLQQRRAPKQAVRFQTFARVNFRQWVQRGWENLWPLVKDTASAFSKLPREERIARARQLARQLGTKGVTSVLGLTLMAAFGPGLYDWWKGEQAETNEQTARNLFEALFGFAMMQEMGGPPLAAMQNAITGGFRDEDPAVVEILKMTPFYDIPKTVADALDGKGRFQDLDPTMLQFWRRAVHWAMPGARLIDEPAYADQGLAIAIQKRWEAFPPDRSIDVDRRPHVGVLRQMEYDIVQQGGSAAAFASDEAMAALAEAARLAEADGKNGWDTVARALRHRKKLEGLTPEQEVQLKEQLGPGYERLVEFDYGIQSLIDVARRMQR